MTMLINLADRLSKSRLLRHFVFLFSALITVWLSGYKFGVFDQVIHISFLNKVADPSLYPGNAFLGLQKVHYSFFWEAFIPFWRLGILEPVIFITHLLSTYLTFWMFYTLAETIFHDRITNLFVTVLMIFPHASLPGFQMIEPYLTYRNFTLPFLLLTLILYLRRRYLWAFFILGLIYNLNVLSVNFILAMLGMDCLLRFRTVKWWNIMGGIGLFLIGASPILIWRIGGPPIDFSLRPEAFDVIARGWLYPIFFIFGHDAFSQLNLFNLLTLISFFFISKNLTPSEYDVPVRNFVIGIGVLMLVAIGTAYLLPVTAILQFQTLRVAYFLLFIGYLFFANFLSKQYQSGKLQGAAFWIISFTFVTFLSPVLTLVEWFIRRLFTRRWVQIAMIGLLAGLNITTMIIGNQVGIWSPGIDIYRPHNTWVEAQDWARQNTPIDALFITPPQTFWFDTPDWQTFSQRNTVVSLAYLQEIMFEPNLLPDWEARFETLAPGAIARFNGSPLDNINFTDQAYNRLTQADFLRVASTYHATYLVVEADRQFNLPVSYKNSGYTIYDLRGLIN